MEKIKVRSADGNSYWMGTLAEVKRWALETCHNPNQQRRQDAALRHFGALDVVVEKHVEEAAVPVEKHVFTYAELEPKAPLPEPVVVSVPSPEALVKQALLAAALLNSEPKAPEPKVVASKPDTSHRGMAMRTWRWQHRLSRAQFAKLIDLSMQYTYLLEMGIKPVVDKVWTRFEMLVDATKQPKAGV